jgi:hypothetical protein
MSHDKIKPGFGLKSCFDTQSNKALVSAAIADIKKSNQAHFQLFAVFVMTTFEASINVVMQHDVQCQ